MPHACQIVSNVQTCVSFSPRKRRKQTNKLRVLLPSRIIGFGRGRRVYLIRLENLDYYLFVLWLNADCFDLRPKVDQMPEMVRVNRYKEIFFMVTADKWHMFYGNYLRRQSAGILSIFAYVIQFFLRLKLN